MKTYLFLLSTLLFLSAACKKKTVEVQDAFWQTADPATLGFQMDSLALALTQAENLSSLYSLLVVKDQKLVVERYFNGQSAEDLFHLRSITKNFTSAMTGIAVANNELPSIDTSIAKYFPSLQGTEKAAISVRHLLNMTAGLEWVEDNEVIDLIELRIPQPIDYLLAKPLSTDPGTTFNYNSLSPHVVAHILSSNGNQPWETQIEAHIFEPLGIKRYNWTRDPEGAVWGGFGLQLRARDLAKFGLLYLQDGQWENEQLIPQSWVAQSAVQQIETSGPDAGYSFQWWVSRSLDTPIYYGLGYGGQALMLVPDKNMLVVANQAYLVLGDQHVRQWNDFVQQIFLPIYRAI